MTPSTEAKRRPRKKRDGMPVVEKEDKDWEGS